MTMNDFIIGAIGTIVGSSWFLFGYWCGGWRWRRLQRDIRKGMADVEAGRVKPWSEVKAGLEQSDAPDR